MIRKSLASPPAHHLIPPTLDRTTAERVTQWVRHWHEADYEPGEITEMLEGWPTQVRLDDLVEPFTRVPEPESGAALAQFVLELVSLVERGMVDGNHARGAFRLACSRLCERGIPFEETAKGDDAALWFHFIASNEFGDPDNTGYATDLGELRLLARLLLDPERLRDDLLNGEFPSNFHEAYVSIAASLGDRRLIPLLLGVLGRCEDAQAVASTISAIGQLHRSARSMESGEGRTFDVVADGHIADTLAGYAFSPNGEIATASVLALETLGGARAEEVLDELGALLPDEDTMLAAHVRFALLHVRKGEERLNAALMNSAQDRNAPNAGRLCAIERLAGICSQGVVQTLASLLDDPTIERVRVDGYLTDDVVHVIREAAFMALMDCPVRYLVEVLGENILTRLETFEMYSLPSWWLSMDANGEKWEPRSEL